MQPCSTQHPSCAGLISPTGKCLFLRGSVRHRRPSKPSYEEYGVLRRKGGSRGTGYMRTCICSIPRDPGTRDGA